MAIRTTYKYACDLDKGTYEINLRNDLMQADSQADAFRVSVTRKGADVNVSSMNAYGYLYIAANQTTIALKGTVSGNTAEVVLTADCYAVPGYASLVIQLHDGDVRHTVLKVNMRIERTGSNRVLSSGDVLPTLAELLNKIAAMEQATATANATIATIKADTAAAIKTTNEATAAANTATVELAKTAGVPVVLTKTGSIVTITDGAARPAVEVISHIEPVQEGEGDPSPNNVRPISGWDSVTAYAAGKNLADAQLTSSTTLQAFVYLVAGQTYTLSVAREASGVYFTDGADVNIIYAENFGVNRLTYTAENTGIYRVRAYYSDNSASLDCKMQVELGSVATTYEPYQGQTLTATLPETVYGGTVDWGTGVLTVDYYYHVFTGNESSLALDTTAHVVRFSGTAGFSNGSYGMFSHGLTSQYSTASMPNISITWRTSGEIYYKNNSLNTLDDFKAFFAEQYDAGTPLQVVYKRMIPVVHKLTPQQLNTLKGTNNVWSDTGDTELTYIADTQLYIDQKFSALEAALLSTGANV